MPMLFASPHQTVRPGRAPQIRGSYQRYCASSFPPGSVLPGVRGNYQRYRSPSFPPGSQIPLGATSTRAKLSPAGVGPGVAAARVSPTAGVQGGFQRMAFNAPPYFSHMGDATDVMTQATDWISSNPLLATGAALAIGALVLGGTSKRRR